MIESLVPNADVLVNIGVSDYSVLVYSLPRDLLELQVRVGLFSGYNIVLRLCLPFPSRERLRAARLFVLVVADKNELVDTDLLHRVGGGGLLVGLQS